MAVIFIIDGIIAVVITITVAAAAVVNVITIIAPVIAVAFAANAALNSLTAIGGHDRQYFNELRNTVVSRRIFILSQSLIAR